MKKCAIGAVFMITVFAFGISSANADDSDQVFPPEPVVDARIYNVGPYAIHKSDVQFAEKKPEESMRVVPRLANEINAKAAISDRASLDDGVLGPIEFVISLVKDFSNKA